MRGAHPGFDGAEGMLDRLTALAHLLQVFVEPLLDPLKNMLMLSAGDAPFPTRGASLSDGAAETGVAPITA